jgi:hypothetical protein
MIGRPEPDPASEGSAGNADAPARVTDAAPAIPLSAILAELPDDAVLPLRWIRERIALELESSRASLDGSSSQPAADDRMKAPSAPSWLTAEGYGRTRTPERSAEWVRDACRAGLLSGARKDGRQWLIPSETTEREDRQKAGGSRLCEPAGGSRRAQPGPASRTPRGRHAPATDDRW